MNHDERVNVQRGSSGNRPPSRAGGAGSLLCALGLVLLAVAAGGCVAWLSRARPASGEGGEAGRFEELIAGRCPRTILSADFKRDGQMELVWANYDSASVSCLTLLPEGRFSVREIPVGQFPGELISADFDGDGFLDLVVANRFSDTVTLLLGGPQGLTVAGEIPVGPFPESLLACDLNGDGLPDLLVSSRDSGSLTLLLGSRSGLAGTRQVTLAQAQGLERAAGLAAAPGN